MTLAACAPDLQRDSNRPASTPTFVLVHGAWHGGWCWQRVQAQLVSQGHRVYAQSLTGLGDRAHLLHPGITLATHVDDVVNLVEWEDLDSIVLCGHSYGGMVITGAAERLLPRIRAIVYLDAFVPDGPNLSMLDLVGPASRAQREAIVQQSGTGYLPPLSAEAMRVNMADRAWVDSKTTPHPFQTWKDGFPSVTAHERVARKFYVRATGLPSAVYDRTAQDRRSRPGWSVLTLPVGHDVMVDAPRDVVDILVRAAGNGVG
jgi:pimeloyl-ACP methyl ester carboxylesterase